MISDDAIAEIKARLNIVDIVAEYVPLKRAGQTFLGLCPFHKEKTPSFNVHPARQCFHCFGCHKGGDVFSFVSAVEGLAFPEVAEKLASRAGVSIARAKQKSPVVATPQTIKALEALEWATKYYHFLLNRRPEGRAAHDYLLRRGLSQKAIDRFRLGVSPNGWRALHDEMLKRGYSVGVLEEAGLVIVREQGRRCFDRFRSRLMFPITDKDGKTIGFGARTLTDSSDQPKYLNSSDSVIFSKRRNLYGLFENARGIRLRGEAIIVEGYMDVIGLWEKGVDNAVAVMGTALSPEHCQQIRSLTNRVVTVFDPDRAGEEAWRQSIHTFLETGIIARDVSLPQGQDPDEYIQEHGAESFFSLCEKAPRQVTKWLKQVAAKGQLSEQQRTEILDDLSPILRATRRLPDRVTLWDDIGLVLGVSASTLCAISEKAPASAVQTRPSPACVAPRPVVAPAKPKKRLKPLDLAFFRSVLVNQERFRDIAEAKWAPGIQSTDVLEALKMIHRAAPDAVTGALQELLGGHPTEELGSAISAFLVSTGEGSVEAELEFASILAEIRRRQREAEIKSLSTQARLAQRMGDEADSLKLLKKIGDLRASMEPGPRSD